jgi:hypothetical protein
VSRIRLFDFDLILDDRDMAVKGASFWMRRYERFAVFHRIMTICVRKLPRDLLGGACA